jgi:hypothetical protein
MYSARREPPFENLRVCRQGRTIYFIFQDRPNPAVAGFLNFRHFYEQLNIAFKNMILRKAQN